MGDAQRPASDRQRAAFEYLLRGPDGNVLPAPKRLPRPPVIDLRDAVGRIVIEDGRGRLGSWGTKYNLLGGKPNPKTRPLSHIFWNRGFEEFGENDELVPFFIEKVLNEWAISEYSVPSFAHLTSTQQMNLLFMGLKDVEPDKVDFACRTAYVYMTEMLAQTLVVDMYPGVKFKTGSISDKPEQTYEYRLCYITEEYGGPGTLYPLMSVSTKYGEKSVSSLHGLVKKFMEEAMLKLLPDEEITEGREWFFGGTESSRNKWQEHLTELYFMVVGAAFCVQAFGEKIKPLVEDAWTYEHKKGNMYIGLHPVLKIADEDTVPTWAMTQNFDTKGFHKKIDFLGPWVAKYYGSVFLSDREKFSYKSPGKHWSFDAAEGKAITCKTMWKEEEKKKRIEQREAEKKEDEKRKSESGAAGGKAKRRRG